MSGSGEDARTDEEHVQSVLDAMSPSQWYVATWVQGGNYIHGHVDPADRKAMVQRILDLSHFGGSPGHRRDCLVEHCRPTCVCRCHDEGDDRG